MIALVLKNLIAVIGALWLGIAGAYGMWWWDREPARPAWTQAHFLFLAWPHWLRDPSLAAQDVIVRAQLAQADRNQVVLQDALTNQNQQIQALSAQGLAALAKAQVAVDVARTQEQRAQGLAETLAALPHPVATDDCPALDLGDRPFVAYLRTAP